MKRPELEIIFVLLLPFLLPLSLSHNNFNPEDNYLLTFTPTSSSFLSTNSTHLISPTSPPHISGNPFSFSFPIYFPGPHVLRLHFLPLHPPTRSLFSLLLSNFTLLTQFSPSLTGPTIEEFFLDLESTLTITLVPLREEAAYVNAVELYSVPEELNLLLKGRALEVQHRVNVGGPVVTAEIDTLWRRWIPDDGFLVGERRGDEVRFQGRIFYPEGGATQEVAPDGVYATARQMGSRDNSSLDIFNLTWVFPVATSTQGHLVRLHFCDIVSKALYQLYFTIYINNYTVLEDLDLSAQHMTLASPYYIDFLINSTPSGHIRISIGPSNRILSPNMNAILNGIEIMKIHTVPDPFPILESERSNVHVIIWYILGSVALFCLLSMLVVVLHKCPKKKEKRKVIVLGNSCSNLSLKIGFSEILQATNNFDEKCIIGFGGFGKVYKGKLKDGSCIAVKRGYTDEESIKNGSESKQGLNEFQSEISILTKIRHRHLVSLIGYCHERSEMIVVYEFVPNGSFRDNLYGSLKTRHLSWRQRLEICVGAARGLHYLHTGTAHEVVIHRDVKSSNILLDEELKAKVGDFGLSRSVRVGSEDEVSTGVKGSFGYLDPEYFRTRKLTEKSDVYSFGVVLLEALCGRAVVDKELDWEEVNLAEWGMKWQKKGRLRKIIDQSLEDEVDEESLVKFGEIVEKCLEKYGEDRPSMGDVLWNLEFALRLHLQSSQPDA